MSILFPFAVLGLIVFLFMVVVLRWAFRINPIVARLDKIVSLLEKETIVEEREVKEVHPIQTMPDMR